MHTCLPFYKATAVTTATNWLVNTAVGKIFPLLPLPLAFGFFGLACVGGSVTVYFFQPETANLALEEVDQARALIYMLHLYI